jgi:hypothetical protein
MSTEASILNTSAITEELLNACDFVKVLLKPSIENYRSAVHTMLTLRAATHRLEKTLEKRVVSCNEAYIMLLRLENGNTEEKTCTVQRTEEPKSKQILSKLEIQVRDLTDLSNQLRALEIVSTAIKQVEDADGAALDNRASSNPSSSNPSSSNSSSFNSSSSNSSFSNSSTDMD